MPGSEAIAAEPGIEQALARLAPSRETAVVKGFAEPVPLLRVLAD